MVEFYRLQVELLWRWRPGRRALIRRALVSFLVALVSLAATAWLLPGIAISDIWAAVAAVLVLAALNALIRPLLILLAARRSVILVGILTILFQAAVILAAHRVVPGLQVASFGTALVASFVFAFINVTLAAVLAMGEDDSYYGTLVRELAARRAERTQTTSPGVVIVQIDGLSFPVLAHQIRAGRVPHIARWVRSGRMALNEWEVLLPSQTSASQAGILHGNNDGIPAFRWWDKRTGRLLVSNHPEDATEIQRRISNGEGLLSNDGASVGNLMSGDAVRSYITMATLKDPGQGLGQSRAYSWFFVSPYGYMHTMARFVAEMLKELIQARRQQRAGVEPSMHRGMPYPIARAATNVVLRDLCSALVMEEMSRGTPVIYVDFTDYDEIAHHSGPERGEALDALDGVDRAIARLEKAAAECPRPYEFIVVSDHGQSLGATFLQRYGLTLEELVRQLMGGEVSVIAATGRVEEWGGVNAVLSEAKQAGGATGRLADLATREDSVGERPRWAPTDSTSQPGMTPAAAGRDMVVCASGNLGLIYFPNIAGRATMEQLAELYPGLVAGLAEHPGIGLLMVRSTERGTIAINQGGVRHLDDGRVDGTDPVAQFEGRALESLRRLNEMAECGDIVLISSVDPALGEVAAFEELIGSHGGLGGWQTRPLILHPAAWPIEGDLVGAPAVYRQIRRWLADVDIELGSKPAGGIDEPTKTDQPTTTDLSVARARSPVEV